MQEGAKNPHTRNQGHFDNAPWKKVLVYDRDEQALKVKSKKDIGQSRASVPAHEPN